MLYQLRHPGALLGIAAALLLGLLLHDLAQTALARRFGDDQPARAGGASLRLAPHVEPFGAVCAVVLGWGWGRPLPLDERWRARRWRVAASLVAGPLVYLLLAVAGAALVRVVVAPFGGSGASLEVDRGVVALATTWAALLVVSLLPVPPLDLGRAVLALAPQTLGWQRARLQLEERGIGAVIALAVLLLPRLLPQLPDVVGQLLRPLLDGLGALVGVGGLGAIAGLLLELP